MGSFMSKISRAGLVWAIIGVVLLGFSLGDTITSLKPAKSFEDALDGGVQVGDHVAGEVPYLLDAFANLQTWTENRSNNSRTPAKTSAYYYVLPAGEWYAGLRVGSANIPAANDLVDETYGFLNGGAQPSTVLELDTRVVEMDEELVELFYDEMRDYYGYTDQELEDLGAPLMVEPRAFTTIRVFCAVGAAFFLLGVVLLVRRWRKVSASLRAAGDGCDPELS